MKSVASLVEPVEFAADGVFITRSGELGVVIEFTGPDPECMEDSSKEALTHRWIKALATVRDLQVTQYLFKKKIHGGLYRFDSFAVLMLDAPVIADNWLNSGTADKDLAERFLGRVKSLRQNADLFVSQADFLASAKVLNSNGAWLFLRRLWNYDPMLAEMYPYRGGSKISGTLSDSDVSQNWAERGVLRVNDHKAIVLSLKQPPTNTFPDLLGGLRDMDCESIVITQWKAIDILAARKLLKSKQTFFHNARHGGVPLTAQILRAIFKIWSQDTPQPQESTAEMQKDKAAMDHEDELGDLEKEIERGNCVLGVYSLTVILSSLEKPDPAAALLAFAAHDAVLYQERIGALSVWLASHPGGNKWNKRAMYLTDINHGDMSLLFSVAKGESVNKHLNAPALAVLETRQRSEYDLDLSWGDVFHTAFIGQTGSGKSFSLAWLLDQAIERWGARVAIFDIGGSYRDLTRRNKGSYMDVGLNNSFTMGPFDMPLTDESMVFLHSFVRILMSANRYQMDDPRDDARIEDAIKRLYELPANERRLGALELPDNLAPYLDKWRGRGRFASLFDNVADTLTTNDVIQTFDFEGLDRYREVIEPFLFYVFHRISQIINADRDRFKVFVVDEIYKFFDNPSSKIYIRDAFKQYRKKRAAIWIATQSLEDLVKFGMDETVIENCATTIFLPNPGMGEVKYREAFHLNDVEVAAIRNMRPKRQWLLKRQDGSKILELNVRKEQCTNESQPEFLQLQVR